MKKRISLIIPFAFLAFGFFSAISSCTRCAKCKATYSNGGQNVIPKEFEFCGEALKKVEGGQGIPEIIEGHEDTVFYNCD